MRPRLLALLLIFWALPGSHAQNVDGSQDTTSSGKGAIAGTVVDSLSGQPLKGATVTLRGRGNSFAPSGTTNAEGQFILDGVPQGRYIATAFLDGYVERPGTGSGLSRQWLTVGSGQRMDGIQFRLSPGAIITGRVTDAVGKPLPNASIDLLKRSYRQGRSEFTDVTSVSADAAGEYRIADLAHGEYYLRANADQPQPVKSAAGKAGDETYVPLYYPASTDAEHSLALTVREGEQISGIEMHLAPVRGVHVKGRVTSGVTSLRVKGARVILVGDQGRLTLSPVQPSALPSGGFEFSCVPPGSYVLVASQSASGLPGKTLWGRMPLQVGDLNIDGVEAVVTPGVDISGRFRVDGKATVDLKRLTVELELRDSSAAALTLDTPDAPVNSDGTFLFHEVPEGSYGLSVTLPFGFYLNADGADILEAGITIAHGSAPAPMEFTLEPALGKIDGTVSTNDESPRAGIPVLLVPGGARRSQPRFYRRAITDQSGRFALQRIAPGDYKLFAGDDLEIADFMNLDPSLPSDRGKAVHVDKESHLNLQLEESESH